LDGAGYPLGSELWNKIRDRIPDAAGRDEIQAKLYAGAKSLEHALDLLEAGLPQESIHRHLVTSAIADAFQPVRPPLDVHAAFVSRLARRSEPQLKVFSLNHDTLVEWSAEKARVPFGPAITVNVGTLA
jgi:hypothetical protein